MSAADSSEEPFGVGINGCRRFGVSDDGVALDSRIRRNPSLPDTEPIHLPYHVGGTAVRDVKIVVRPDMLMN
ncbi:MAG: hypothetical protein NTU83_01220, partial [Candidatus Hydrogenedentes bacterium]|nr:hypothetical protein [Candidatus Hydrogenedentota bacterium]